MTDMRTGRVGLLLGLGLVFAFAIATASHAAPGDAKLFKTHYKVRTSELSRCTVCHVLAAGAEEDGDDVSEALNAYGKAWLDAGRDEMAFEQIEKKDSDKDGYSNANEIRNGSNPGDARQIPATGGPDMPSRRDRAPRVDERARERSEQGEHPSATPGASLPGRDGGAQPGDAAASRVPPGQDPFAAPAGSTPVAPATSSAQPAAPATDPFAPQPGAPTSPAAPVTTIAPQPQPSASAAAGAAAGDPFDGYRVLYKVAQSGSSAVHMVQNGQDTVVSQGVALVDSFGWSPDARYVWFVASGDLYLWDGAAARKINGTVVVDPDVIAWSPSGKMVYFGSCAFDEQNVFYGVAAPDGQVSKVLQVPSGTLSAMEVEPRPK